LTLRFKKSSARRFVSASSSLRLCFSGEQRLDFFHVGMRNPCVSEFLEIIQHGLLKCSLVIDLGISVFQIKGLCFVELVIEEERMGEVAFDKY